MKFFPPLYHYSLPECFCYPEVNLWFRTFTFAVIQSLHRHTVFLLARVKLRPQKGWKFAHRQVFMVLSATDDTTDILMIELIHYTTGYLTVNELRHFSNECN